jgi:glycosyltransferase involved in cell wall biosynthesis
MSLAVGFDVSALDPQFKDHAQRGIGRYVRELWGFLQTHRTDAESLGIELSSFDHRDFTKPTLSDRLIDALPYGRNTVRQQLLYPSRLAQGSTRKLGLLHFPAHMDAPSWSIKNYVLTVLDLIPLVLPDLYKADRPGWRFAFARWLENQAIKNARLVLAISHNTARDLQRILKIPEEKIVVTPLGVDAHFFKANQLRQQLGKQELRRQLAERYALPAARPLLLYVGGMDERKNWQRLLPAFQQVAGCLEAQGKARPALVMAGGIASHRHYPKLLMLREELALEQDVLMPGFVPDTDLLLLYAGSDLFCFPSLYEGFGLPPLEALAAGLPVVSSNTSCMPEVLGEAALMVNPASVDSIAQGIQRVLCEPELAASLALRGPLQAQKFTWQRTGEATLEAYRSLQ